MMICWSPPVNNDKVSEVNSGGTKRYVENTQKCTRLNSILASRYCLLGHAGFGLASVDKILLMIHACTRCGHNVEDDISIRVAIYRKLNLCQGREILGLRLAVGGEERPLLRSASIPLIISSTLLKSVKNYIAGRW